MNTKHKAPELTLEQIDAIERFSDVNGRNWKMRARAFWEGYESPETPAQIVIYALRNTHGPGWLKRFRLSDIRGPEL